ncbi:MAG: hypothetical protein HC913_23405 [Microscillaceae bacterium]|nr:hypothetical protein [Microscillaceae bacterium]
MKRFLFAMSFIGLFFMPFVAFAKHAVVLIVVFPIVGMLQRGAACSSATGQAIKSENGIESFVDIREALDFCD